VNFFAEQARARRQTRRMVVLFAIAVVVIVAAIDLVLLVLLRGRHGHFDPSSLAITSAVVLAVIAFGSLYRIASLSGGGAKVAQELGATPVAPDTIDFALRRLHNVVEEMAIAAGMPVPDVFVLENEPAINAFASGFSTADAAITVTRGCLDKLTREELQGVIGHEFSHVLNGDMRLNLRLMGVVFGILVISVVGRKVAQAAAWGRGRNNGIIIIAGFAVFVVGYIGVVCARIIKASISRQREFLADASSVQFTRQPGGIAGALKKIGGLAEGSKLASKETEEVSHMLFGDGVGYSALFATHPPLLERIRRLDPGFSEHEFASIATAWQSPVRVGDAAGAGLSIGGFAPVGMVVATSATESAGLPAPGATVTLAPGTVIDQVGHPGTDDRRAAARLHRSLPDSLRACAHEQSRAPALVLALVLSDEEALRARQLAMLEQHYDATLVTWTVANATRIATLHPMQRLPLAAMAFPALRKRPRAELEGFADLLGQLVRADERVTLEEYCLVRLVRAQVLESLDPSTRRSIGRTRLPEVRADVIDLFAVVAQHGHDDPVAAAHAFAFGLDEVLPRDAIRYEPPEDFASALDRALPRLDALVPAGKELVLRGLTRAISNDGEVSLAEAELLRTICASLHCPLPPMLQSRA
jgi:Zn-dependent protease with chaperone function